MDELKLEKCCRTCLRTKRPSQMKLLSTKWNDVLSFADMLVDITKMPKEIALPGSLLKICSTCEQDLIAAYNFGIVCQNTEQVLADRLIQSTVPPIEKIKLENYNDGLPNSGVQIKVDSVRLEEPVQQQTELCEVQSSPSKKPARKRIRKPKEPNEKKRNTPGKQSNNLVRESTDNKQADNVEKDVLTEMSSEPKKKQSRKNRKPSLYCKRCDIKYETNKEYMRHCQEVMKSCNKSEIYISIH